jgi:hypothetical protein
MKGVKTMSLANATSKRFQSDDIITRRVHLPDGLELVETLKKMMEEQKKLSTALTTITELTTKVKELTDKVKELDDKLNSLEVE